MRKPPAPRKAPPRRVPDAIRRRQYEFWKAGVEYSHSENGGVAIGIERGVEQRNDWSEFEGRAA